MGWKSLPIGFEYYVVSEELEHLVSEILGFLFSFSFSFYFLITILFFVGLMVLGVRYLARSMHG
jgi:hypothetical protein